MKYACFAMMFAMVIFTSIANAAELQISPGYEKTENADDSNGLLRLQGKYVQGDNGGAIVFEAENASVLRFTPSKAEVHSEASASGGMSVAHVQHAEYHFIAREAGKYDTWYRASYPLKGNWNHTENLNNETHHQMTDSYGDELNTWIWHHGVTYEVPEGQNSWNLTPFGFMGGAKLDKIMLLPEGSEPPQGMGPEPSKNVGASHGVAYTQPIDGNRVSAWTRLSMNNLSGHGEYDVAWSVDDGQTWTDLADNGDISEVPVGKMLRFRINLKRDEQGRTPVLSRPVVNYRVDAQNEVVLEDERMRWTFAGEDGSIIGLYNKQTDTHFIEPGVSSPLFNFRAIRGMVGAPQVIWFSQGQLTHVDDHDNKVVFHHSFVGGELKTQMTVELIEEGMVRFSLHVDNNSDWNICETSLPSISGLRVGEDEKDDVILWPTRTGNLTPYPARMAYPAPGNPNRGIRWPGDAFVCFMHLYDESGNGLYIANYDPEFYYTEFDFAAGYPPNSPQAADFSVTIVAGATEEDNIYPILETPAPWITVGYTRMRLIDKTTGPVTLPDVVIGMHSEGDWKWGADHYREWAASWMKKDREVPDWIRDIPGYLDSHMGHLGSFVDLSKNTARAWVPQIPMDESPFPLVVMWAQMASKESAWAGTVLDYMQGTPEQFAGGIERLNEMGTRFICYSLPPRMNPMFDEGSTRNGGVPISKIPNDETPPDGFFKDIGMRRYNGALVNSDTSYSEGLVDFCNPKWREYLFHILHNKYIATYGTHGMYLDAMGLASYRREMRSHGYGYGTWHHGWQKFMRELREHARNTAPGAVFLGEGNCDVDMNLIDWGLMYNRNAPFVYRYTIPWGIGVMHKHSTRLFEPFTDDQEMEFAITMGYRVGITTDLILKIGDGFYQGLDFWNHFNQWQFRARFIDDLGMSLSDDRVYGKLYHRDDDANHGVIWVGMNDELVEGVELRIDRKWVGDNANIAHAWTWDGDSMTIPTRMEGDEYVVTLPTSHMAAVMLAERAEPFVEVVGRPSPIVPGQTGTVRARVRHMGPTRASGTLKLRLPAGWQSQPVQWTLQPGEAFEHDFQVTVPGEAEFGDYEFHAVATRDQVTADRATVMGLCRPVRVEVYPHSPTSYRVELIHRGSNPVEGVCSLNLPKPVESTNNDQPFALNPGETVNLIFEVTHVEQITTRQGLEAVARYNGGQSIGHGLIQPDLPNGDFELSIENDGFPDYWTYRKPNNLYYEYFEMDSQIKKSGKYSLRIDGYDKTHINSVQNPYLRLVPGQKYRFSAWIRKDASAKGIGIIIHHRDGHNNVVPSLMLREDAEPEKWHYLETEFTALDRVVPTLMVCQNSSRGKANAWFDDIRLEPIE